MLKSLDWQAQSTVRLPEWFVEIVGRHAPQLPGHRAAQLLWQRGIQEPEQLAGFLDPQLYQPADPYEFGQEMQWAVERLRQARGPGASGQENRGEMVAIWGDFDADGITATAVLWEGLGQFFAQNAQLVYYIPNRLTESHGLSCQGLDALAQQGCRLVVTCDTGSTNLSEIHYAHRLGMDVIVTDHHTLPPERPPVTAIINPRYLAPAHPLFHLSGVAVAYKLVEALYATLPDVPQQPLENLLDLVAIGLIADLVQLSGDCRYLAQRGIQRLQQQRALKTRPGVARLLELCQRSGDRPTDISFGIGPRINAVSRIQGDARFCVELLTSHDVQLCDQLAAETELANARRKSLQKEVAQQVEQKLKQLDLSTTSVIVLADDQWPTGVLGLVAAQVAEEQGRPTILLSTDCLDLDSRSGTQALARGSARSVNQVDLYQLVKAQAHLLHRFGGHPFAAGLSLPVENITLFSEAINQQFRQDYSVLSPTALNVQADLIVTVAELVADLGKTLFQELKLLEPCGMGNPVPKLLIYNCWFDNARHRNIHDAKGHKLRYIKTQFTVRDDTTPHGFPGVWWGHYRDDIPPGRCDAVVELDHNSYADKSTRQKPHYEVRLVAVWPSENNGCRGAQIASSQGDEILSWRRRGKPELSGQTPVLVDQGLLNNSGLPGWQPPLHTGKTGAIADPASEPPQQWHQLVGIAKYLHRTEGSTTCRQLQEKLGISQLCLDLGLQALRVVGFEVTHADTVLKITHHAGHAAPDLEIAAAIAQFLAAVQEEQFRRHYFAQVPVAPIEAVAPQMP